MIPRSVADVASAVQGLLSGPEARDMVSTICIDSRSVEPGSLFVALAGERTHGAAFVEQAFAAGAVAALVPADSQVEASGPVVRVPSTEEALMRLAADERRRLTAKVVGVTGANGKTTTKDMTDAVVGRRFASHKSPRSFNNEIGLPFTLLTAPAGTEVIVAEMGARHVGDVTALCEIAMPDIVVVTNVGTAHMEEFGSWDRIVESSAEPVEAIGPSGIAVLNADDTVVREMASKSKGQVVFFGSAQGTQVARDVRSEDVKLGTDGRASFTVAYGEQRAAVTLDVPGEHMVSNALAATAVGTALGVPLSECAEALGSARLSPGRMETFTSPEGFIVINDAYNANPESMAAAMRAAKWMARDRKLIAVIGPMNELGAISHQEHERLGDLAARLRVDRLVTFGPGAVEVAVAAVREGCEPENVSNHDDPGSILKDVRTHARPGDVVLFKASNSHGLWKLAEELR